MKHRPRVSVCVPTVDRPELLQEAIASIAQQTWKDLEVVVGDNSADPDLHRKVDDVLARFPNLTFVVRRHRNRLDAIDNFNSLIDAATGDFWACLPDDDRFMPEFLELSVAALNRHPECAFTFSDHAIMSADGNVDEAASTSNSIRFSRASLQERVYSYDELFPLALKQSICLQTALFRRSTIAALRFLPGIMLGDHSLFLRLSTGSVRYNGYYIRKRLFAYRLHPAQITTTTKRRDLLRAQIDSYASAESIPSLYRSSLNQKIGRCYLALAFLDAEEGDTLNAREHALLSLRYSLTARSVTGAGLIFGAPKLVSSVRWLNHWIMSVVGSKVHRQMP